MKLPLLALLAAMTGCANTPRFLDRPIVWKVDDARDIPEPEENVYRRHVYFAEIFLLRRSTRALELRTERAALSTNALDEVPDSTWFTNRVGVREVTPQEGAKGVGEEPEAPYVVVEAKVGGGNPGFIVKDRRGRKYIVKFDVKENPEMQTATDAIVSRIFWVAGYHTPADHVIHFRRDELTLDPKAKIDDALTDEREMKEEDIERVLATSPTLADGSFRGLASKFLSGKPIGGFEHEGTRDDDPNDTIPHEHRRELRGLMPLAAWVNHTDMKEDNTLDMYVEENGKKFVRHYFVDFGEAFAAHAAEKGRREDGYEHFWDWSAQPRALFALGFWKRPWEDLENTPWPSIGMFDAENFKPELYKPAYPWWPFFEADAADLFWGAKIVMRFDRPLLEAIVAEGKLSDPEAAKYLVDTLIARRDKVGKTYLERVTPLDRFELRGELLCAVDLSVHHRLARAGIVEVLGSTGRKAERAITVAQNGDVCIPLAKDTGYQVYRLRTRRDRITRPVMQVHVIRDATPRIVGLIRVEGEE